MNGHLEFQNPNFVKKIISRIESLQVFERQSQSVMAIRFSRDATYLVATGGDKLVTVYDVVSFCSV